MQKRKLKIVKLTPIALATCERCNTTFQSYRRIEDEAEREMKTLFERHDCEFAGAAPKEVVGLKKTD